MTPLAATLPNTPSEWDAFWQREGPSRLEGFSQGDKPYEILRWIEPGETVLDVGTGIGKIPLLMKSVRPNLDVAVCDLSAAAVEFMQSHALPFSEIFRADVEDDIPRSAQTYDVVMATEVLEHVAKPDQVIAELLRLARRKVIVMVPYRLCIRDEAHVWSFDLDDVYELLAPRCKKVMLTVVNGRSNVLAVGWK